MTRCVVLFLILLAGLAPTTSLAGYVGDPASPLVVQEWLKGGPFEIKPGTNILVLEVWQTKGAASRVAITNLNRLQERFKSKGVVVVGVSDEPVETIKDFLQHDGTNIQYAIAADLNRRTCMAYMEPAGQLGVPYAFVVGTNGTLLCHAHVLHGLDQAVEQIVAGTFDAEHAVKEDVAHRQMQQYLALAARGDARARAAGKVLLAARTNDLESLCDMAFEITAQPVSKRDFALAGAALSQAEKLAPTNSARIMIYRAQWLFEGGQRDAGFLLATQALACAQSPGEKAGVQSLLDTMAARQRLIKERASATNLVNGAVAPNAGLGAATNRIDAEVAPQGGNPAANQP